MVLTVPFGLVMGGGNSIGVCLASGNVVQASSSTDDPSDIPLLPQATLDAIEERDLRGRAEQNMERYAYAEAQTGVPWAAIAALHYREAGMRGEASALNGQPITGYAYKNVDGQTVGATPKEDAVNAANAFKRLALGVYDIDVTKDNLSPEDWGWAFLAYNRGYLYKNVGASYTLSPYVMNGLDAQHMNMSWSSADTVRGIDGNTIGALAALIYLDSQSIGTGGCGNGDIVAPVKGENLVVTSGAGQRARYSAYEGRNVNRIHYGIDIIGGSEILAAHAGTVTLAESYGGYGYAVKIDRGDGIQTLYGHMVAGSLLVSKGDTVSARQPIGTMGTTGDSDGVHLHFEVWQNDARINPFAFLVENGVKLTWQEGADPYNVNPGPLG